MKPKFVKMKGAEFQIIARFCTVSAFWAQSIPSKSVSQVCPESTHILIDWLIDW